MTPCSLLSMAAAAHATAATQRRRRAHSTAANMPAAASTSAPVGLGGRAPRLRNGVGAGVGGDDGTVVFDEPVARGRQIHGDGRREHERDRPPVEGGQRLRHAPRGGNRLYRSTCNSAATPSRHVIFLPSAYVRPL